MNSSQPTSVPSWPNNAYNLNNNNGNINNDNKSNDNNNYARCVQFEKETKSVLFTFENIYQSYTNCRKRKRNTANALKFEENLEQNLQELYYALNNKNSTYFKQSNKTYKTVSKYVKPVFFYT